MKAFLRDLNPELINTYLAVRDFPRELMRRLDEHAVEFKAKGDDYFYFVRASTTSPATTRKSWNAPPA